MKRIIEDVLEAEEKVGVILKQAREKAVEIRRSAENAMSEKTNEAKQAAREIVRIAVEDAKRDAERIRTEKLELVDAQKDTLLSGKSSNDDRKDVIDGLVDEICNVIKSTELRSENDEFEGGLRITNS